MHGDRVELGDVREIITSTRGQTPHKAVLRRLPRRIDRRPREVQKLFFCYSTSIHSTTWRAGGGTYVVTTLSAREVIGGKSNIEFRRIGGVLMWCVPLSIEMHFLGRPEAFSGSSEIDFELLGPSARFPGLPEQGDTLPHAQTTSFPRGIQTHTATAVWLSSK